MGDNQPVFRAPCHLRRIAADVNVWRYYTLTLWPDLFGGMTLVREWGRISQDGTVMRQHFTDTAAAERELDRIARSKVRRGYRPITLWSPASSPPGAMLAEAAPDGPRPLIHARNARPAPAGSRAGERSRITTRHAMREAQVTVDPPRPTAAACRV